MSHHFSTGPDAGSDTAEALPELLADLQRLAVADQPVVVLVSQVLTRLVVTWPQSGCWVGRWKASTAQLQVVSAAGVCQHQTDVLVAVTEESGLREVLTARRLRVTAAHGSYGCVVPVFVKQDLYGILVVDQLLESPAIVLQVALMAVAQVVASIIERQMTEDQLQDANAHLESWVDALNRHVNEMNTFSAMSERLQSCLSVEEAYVVVSRFLRQLFPRDSGALYLHNQQEKTLESVETWGVRVAGDEHEFACASCMAVRRERMQVVEPSEHPLCHHGRASASRGYLCIPMIVQDELLGIMKIYSESNSFSEMKQNMAATVSEHIALALSNLRLRETLRAQAVRDALTGLYNRRYMEEALNREVRHARRDHRSLVIMMFDIDHFKRFNDTYGHAAGDALLREVGRFLRERIRSEDIACRYGGEEFLLILPSASLEDTMRRAEQFRESIKQVQVEHEGKPLARVTVSIGMAGFPQHGLTTEELLKTADTALYRAKSEGRDRVCVGDAGHTKATA